MKLKGSIYPSVYYRWQKQFFEEGGKAFAPTNEAKVVAQLKQEETINVIANGAQRSAVRQSVFPLQIATPNGASPPLKHWPVEAVT